MTNQTKNSATLTQPTKNPQPTWDEAIWTWNEGTGTWENPTAIISKQTKNSATLAQQTKN